MLKFALIGCGRISKKHIEVLTNNRIRDAKLVCVCDIDIKKAKEVALKLDIPYYDDIHKMLKMGVPQEAVNRQKMLDGKIPPPPPPPNLLNPKNISHIVPKINASDLRKIVLKKGKPIKKQKIKKVSNHFIYTIYPNC